MKGIRRLVAGALLLFGVAGCALPPWAKHEVEPAEELTVTTVEVAPSLFATAIPSYRLIVSPRLADAPSRLMAVHARFETYSEQPLHFSPLGVRLRLPDGTSGRAFDRPRAIEILERAELGAADLSYLAQRNGRRPPGGLYEAAKSVLKNQLKQSLLGEVDFSRDRPIEGYLIVDVGRPVASLEGALLEIEATRISDAIPARGQYALPIRSAWSSLR